MSSRADQVERVDVLSRSVDRTPWVTVVWVPGVIDSRLKGKHSKLAQKAENESAFLAGQCSCVIRWRRSSRRWPWLPWLPHRAICVNMSSILLSPCSVHNLFIKMLHLLKGKGRGFLFNVGGQNRQRPPKEHGPTVWKAADRLPGIELNPVTSCLESAAPTTVHQHMHELFTALIRFDPVQGKRFRLVVWGWCKEIFGCCYSFGYPFYPGLPSDTRYRKKLPLFSPPPPPQASPPDLLWKVCCNQFH